MRFDRFYQADETNYHLEVQDLQSKFTTVKPTLCLIEGFGGEWRGLGEMCFPLYEYEFEGERLERESFEGINSLKFVDTKTFPFRSKKTSGIPS